MPYADRTKQNAYARKWYAQNKEAHIKLVKKNNARRSLAIKALIKEHLLKNPCIDCGNPDLRVLEFDHVRGKKKYNVADLHRHGSVAILQKEIAKCEVRCANCHRIRHSN